MHTILFDAKMTNMAALHSIETILQYYDLVSILAPFIVQRKAD